MATATLTIRSNASSGMTAVSLSGTGEKAFANLVVSPASISFGNLNLKATSQQNVTLQNTGDISVTIQGITVAGASLSSPATLSLSGDGIAPGPPPPPPPVQHTVTLTWNASTGSVVGYKVFRSEVSGGSYGALTGAAISILTYADTTVGSGTTYYYVVTSVDSAGTESAYSNQVTAVVPSP